MFNNELMTIKKMIILFVAHGVGCLLF